MLLSESLALDEYYKTSGVSEWVSLSHTPQHERDHVVFLFTDQLMATCSSVCAVEPEDWTASPTTNYPYVAYLQPFAHRDIKQDNLLIVSGSSDQDLCISNTCKYDVKVNSEETIFLLPAAISWLDFCKRLFPFSREHTPEERKAYSEFIESYFEEISI